MFIPDPIFFHPGSELFPSRIRIKEIIFNPKNGFSALGNMIRVVHPGSGSWLFTHLWSGSATLFMLLDVGRIRTQKLTDPPDPITALCGSTVSVPLAYRSSVPVVTVQIRYRYYLAYGNFLGISLFYSVLVFPGLASCYRTGIQIFPNYRIPSIQPCPFKVLFVLHWATGRPPWFLRLVSISGTILCFFPLSWVEREETFCSSNNFDSQSDTGTFTCLSFLLL